MFKLPLKTGFTINILNFELGSCGSTTARGNHGKLLNIHASTIFLNTRSTLMILNFRRDRSGQTMQTQIRLLLVEQSDQGFHCLLFHLPVFDKIP